MPTWREIGVQTYRDAVALHDGKRYRSAVARFYYAVFAIVTDELLIRKAKPKFTGNRATPSHGQITSLVDSHFVNMTQIRRGNVIKYIAALYGSRISADYSLKRVDKRIADESMRKADAVFKALGVSHDNK